MAKCKWCECDAEVNRHGYCESCNASVREDIKAHIAALTELTEQAAPFLPDDEKTAIHKTMLEEYEILKGYKAKKVPFFKSDIEVLKANVIKKLGMEEGAVAPAYPAVTAKKKNNNALTIVFTLIFVLPILIIFFAIINVANDPETMMIKAAKTAVMRELEYPSSASFLSGGEEVYPISHSENVPGAYVVNSYVTANNYLGQRVRSIFRVTMIYRKATKEYEILDVKFE